MKQEYGLPNNSYIYILKVDVLPPGAKSPKVEYELYYPLNGTNLTLLNMSICKNDKIKKNYINIIQKVIFIMIYVILILQKMEQILY